MMNIDGIISCCGIALMLVVLKVCSLILESKVDFRDDHLNHILGHLN
jgi:hypothetical protein